MPTVDLHSKADYASIYYRTNTPHCNVGGFDPEKPTLVILHPAFLDSTWVDSQMGDSRFDNNYNIIALDMRSCGKSVCRPNGRHDSWVDAADLAFCFQKLHLPPSHILGLEGTSIYCALRFAVLFPELCLSLTLVNVPAPVEVKWIYKNVDELIHAACFAEDLDLFEQAAFECIEFLFGPLIAYWETNMCPSKRARTAETTSLYINRAPMSPEAYSLITQPVLIIQGEKNELCPAKHAERLLSQLTGVKDGAVIYEVKGGRSMISVIPGYTSIVNNVFYKFLMRLPHHRSDIVPPKVSLKDRMKTALNKLSEITGLDTISLDPLCSISFSCVTPDFFKGQTELLRHYLKDASQAFTPTPVEGMPLRKYSQRERDEWSYIERGRLSNGTALSGTAASHPDRVKVEVERTKTSSRPEQQQSPTDTPLLKTAFSSSAMGVNEKQTTKKSRTFKGVDHTQTTASSHRMLA
ncbi:hypothetical protein GALMADRAFT_235659 [Galerina marginata CBS 339.88]|uniref:AB hydrolase-1 domain-containing protein n=1 Tax=Galerina marginata (strain CBS 339.88) TaxID=685588 RepID=A0A067TUC5_GALM3|nr:hypothetical protein GALMADRAFT_235659 [Galerina marginata CBS 339.88]